MRWVRFVALLLVSTAIMSWPVWADTVNIGLEEGGGPIATVASATGQTSFTGSFGSFSSVTVAGHGQGVLTAPDLLFADTIDTATASGGTLMVWVTDQGLSAPLGTLPFTSSFTANVVPAGWTITESTFVSSTNALFGGTPLSAATFSAIGTGIQTAMAVTGPGPYSVTEEFIISASGAGDANNTIDLSATSVSATEPSPLIGLAVGLVGVGFLLRRRL